MFEADNHHAPDKESPPGFTTGNQDQNPGTRNSVVVPPTWAIHFGNWEGRRPLIESL